jgi:hypothetical protein
MQVICNRARKSCSHCLHSTEHTINNKPKKYHGYTCTVWGTCFEFPDGQETPVRCTKVKVLTAQKEEVDG